MRADLQPKGLLGDTVASNSSVRFRFAISRMVFVSSNQPVWAVAPAPKVLRNSFAKPEWNNLVCKYSTLYRFVAETKSCKVPS